VGIACWDVGTLAPCCTILFVLPSIPTESQASDRSEPKSLWTIVLFLYLGGQIMYVLARG
jgi:hypothetical protein